MRKLLHLTGIFFLILLLFISATLYLAIDSQPQIQRAIVITPEQIARARLVLDAHQYQIRPDKPTTIDIQTDDLDHAFNYLTYHCCQGRAQILTENNSLFLQASLPVPIGTIGYLNLSAQLIETVEQPKLSHVKIGGLSVPDSLANLLASQFFSWLQMISPDIQAGVDAFKDVQISRDNITISYYWQGWQNSEKKYPSFGPVLLSKQDLKRLAHYHHFLNEYSRQHRTRSIPLSEILAQIMRETIKYAPQGNVQEEFRAAILITAFHAIRIPPKIVLPDAADWPDLVKANITLDGRTDFAMHFMASAAITVYTDTILSNAIGLYKELEDARSGSGFSFNDIIANRSGTQFAEKAMVNQDTTRRMRNRLIAGIQDTDLIPYWKDLPEHMSEKVFTARFGGVDSPRYQKMMETIERRVASLKLLQ